MAAPHKPITQIPVLCNPLLNCLFNNPNYNKAPFKLTINELSLHHPDYAVLLPPTIVLNECFDPATELSSRKVLLRELCFTNEEFIQSHVLKITSYSSSVAAISKQQLTIYTTLNNKQVLIKNGMVFTGKGFKRSLKLSILHNGYINTFRDYFPKGSKIMLIYVDDSLYGSFSVSTLSIQTEVALKPSSDSGGADTITFEKLLRNFPMLSTVVSDRFYRLFHHNNSKYRLLHTSTRKPLMAIKTEFSRLIDEAFSIVLDSVRPDNPYGEQTHDLISHILHLYPKLDLNKLVFEYVELNLYDKLWNQLLIQFNYPNTDKNDYDQEAMRILTVENYEKLSCLSLNQLDMPPQTPWNMNLLQIRVTKSIEELSKLQDSSVMNLAQKSTTLINAISILTDTTGTDLIIDADTLIGLLIMVVIHAKVLNLEAYLYYIKNFNSLDYSNDGQFNYILSNFDAVIYHLSTTLDSSSEDSDLVKSSYENFDFWSAIENNDYSRIEETLAQVNKQYPNGELPTNHFLKSKNINGESALMYAIKSRNHQIFQKLLTCNPNWFSIDDILFDKNITTSTTLLMASIIEECDEISRDLVEIVLLNCTPEEQYAYFNSTDSSGRTIGHYLFHDIDLIDTIGSFIDWEIKDMNSHTPLLSLCRCYDHQDYGGLLKKVFENLYSKYGRGNINFNKHVDKMGNTLLHVILKDLQNTELLSDRRNLIDLDQTNNRNMTPLTISIKYNRLEMLIELLKDNRLTFLFEDSKNFYNVFDYIGYLNGKSYNSNATFKEIEQRVFEHFITNFFPATNNTKLVALNAKYDPNRKDWVIFLKSSTLETNQIYLDKLRQILYITKLENMLTIFPDETTFWMNYKTDMTSMFPKYQINRLLENLNRLFILITFQNTIDQEKLFQKFINSSSVLPKDENLTFELIQHINKLQELQKEKLGSLELTLSNIDEVEVFLKFSIKDLQQYETWLGRLTKLILIADIKQNDLQSVYDDSLRKYFQLENIKESGIQGNYLLHDSHLNTLHSFVQKLDLSLVELINNVLKVLAKINNWKQIYKEIRQLNGEIRAYEDHMTPEHNGTAPSLARRNTFTIPSPEDIPNDDATSSFFNFSSIVKNKTARYKQLILVKSDKIKQILNLNCEIKIDHEEIAGEISNFLQLKPNFFKFAVKQYVNKAIIDHEHRKLQLSTILAKLSSRSTQST